MRSRKDIEFDGRRKEILTLEVLLDIRDLLKKTTKKTKRVKNEVHRENKTQD